MSVPSLVFHEVVRLAGVPFLGRHGQRPQPLGHVAGAPQQQSVELFLEVMLVRELLELVVFAGVRWVRAHTSVTQEHRRRDDAANRGSEIQVTVQQFQLEPVKPQTSVANVSDICDLGFPELLVEWRGTECLVLVVILDERSGRCGGTAQPERGQEDAADDAGDGAAGWLHGGQLITERGAEERAPPPPDVGAECDGNTRDWSGS